MHSKIAYYIYVFSPTLFRAELGWFNNGSIRNTLFGKVALINKTSPVGGGGRKGGGGGGAYWIVDAKSNHLP